MSGANIDESLCILVFCSGGGLGLVGWLGWGGGGGLRVTPSYSYYGEVRLGHLYILTRLG